MQKCCKCFPTQCLQYFVALGAFYISIRNHVFGAFVALGGQHGPKTVPRGPETLQNSTFRKISHNIVMFFLDIFVISLLMLFDTFHRMDHFPKLGGDASRTELGYHPAQARWRGWPSGSWIYTYFRDFRQKSTILGNWSLWQK